MKALFFGLTGAALCLALLEAMLHLLPVSTSTEKDYYADPLILTYPPRHEWVSSTGWDMRNAQTLRSNNAGYAAQRDFVRDANAIALVGDSYAESSMLDVLDRPATQLEVALISRPVYAMGVPGTSLLDYAERIRFAQQKYGIKDFVVMMERHDVRQSLCGSGNVNGPCLDAKTFAPQIETLAHPSYLKKIARQSLLAEYLVGQLKSDPKNLQRQFFSQLPGAAEENNKAKTVDVAHLDPNAAITPIPYVDAVTATFFNRVKPHIGGRLVIILDCDRPAIYSGKVATSNDRERFIALAKTAGAIIVDTEPLFRSHWATHKTKFDVGPYDGHFNPLGIAIITRAATQALREP